MAAIRAFLSSLLLAISASFSSLLMLARLGAAAAVAAGATAADVPVDEADGAGEAVADRAMGSDTLFAAAGAGDADGVTFREDAIGAEGMAGASVGAGALACEAFGLGTEGDELPFDLALGALT